MAFGVGDRVDSATLDLEELVGGREGNLAIIKVIERLSGVEARVRS